MPPEFSLSQESLDAERHVVAVRGEIDLFTAPDLKSALSEAIESGHDRIVVDLTDTTFLDSTALGVILASAQRMAERGGRFELVCGSPSIRRILDMTMISRTVHLLP